MNKKIIFLIILIALILVLLFLSQRTGLKVASNSFVSTAMDQASAYVANGASWATSKIGPKIIDISQGAKSGGVTIQNEINQVKENISDAGKKVENYFSGIKDAILGKESDKSDNCPAQ